MKCIIVTLLQRIKSMDDNVHTMWDKEKEVLFTIFLLTFNERYASKIRK
jgi:hypothetical protein